MAFVRSFAHNNSGHGGGTHWVMTGYNFPPADNGQGQNKPGIGAILARHRGANNPSTGLPNYVRMGHILGDGPSWLGSAYAPFDTAGNARNNMNLHVTMAHLADRRGLLHSFDNVNRDIDRSGPHAGLDSFETQAFDLLQSRAREAFDVTREEPRTRDMYGAGNLGKQMLMARRLCEAGVGFVTIHFGGWDMHGQVTQGMSNLGPHVDHAVSAFVEDVHQRGLAGRDPAGHHRRVRPDAAHQRQRRPRPLGAALDAGPVRRRPAHGPGRRRIERQGRSAQDHADHAARPDGDGVPRAGHAARSAVQRPDRPADADGQRRAGD